MDVNAQNNVYKVQFFISCTDNDAQALRKSLAQFVHNSFEMTGNNSVFAVTVEQETILAHNYVMALYIVSHEDGLCSNQINQLLSKLPYDGRFLPIDFTGENSAAIGFISAEYYEAHNYNDNFIFDKIKRILVDMELESPDGIYDTPDGKKFYMGYYKE